MEKQRGVALIVVMLIIALIAIIATNITNRNQLAMRRTINLAEYDQAYWYAMSAEQLAKKIIKQDLDDGEGRVHLQQYWALSDVVFPAEHGQITGKVSDMRACFNLNALTRPGHRGDDSIEQQTLAALQFKSLLIALGMDDFSAEKLSHTVKDYLDEDTVTSPFGAEDAEYEARTVPYRAANTMMNDKSELRAIMGISQNIYQKLAPYICAIPDNDEQLININTITPEQAPVLAAMLQNYISVEEVENIINQRPADGYQNIEDFWRNSSFSGARFDEKIKSSFKIDSNYFLLNAGAQVNEAFFYMQSILKRTKDNDMQVISRQYGVQRENDNKKKNELGESR